MKKFYPRIQGLAYAIFLFFASWSSGFAAEPSDLKYHPLVGIPGFTNTGSQSLPEFVNAVYILVIIIALLIGVVRIAFAGVKYSLSDVITHKEDAKKDIGGVLLGLAILLLPFIVLWTINPNLVKLDVLSGISPIRIDSNPIQTVADINKNAESFCTPRPGKALPPACSGSVAKEDVPTVQECTENKGYWDLVLKKCFSKSSIYTYNTSTGGNWTSFTEAGWIALCGGVDKTDIIQLDETRTYRCKTTK